ncbi:MAG: cytochrome ubiquinol oxidase subunit I, partial [Candidatus Dormibacteraceae bacterium]
LQHWLCSLPLAISGAASALFVVMVNGWMNTPSGFQLDHGQLVKVDQLAAAFNPSVPTEDPHMLFAAYTVTGFLVAAIYAAGMLRGRHDTLHRRGLAVGMGLGGVAVALTGLWGDFSARFLYVAEPVKFAAMEALFKTQQYAPITIGGVVDAAHQRVLWGLEIPSMLSWLAAFNPAAQVTGLDATAPADRPNPLLVHLSFDTMVGFGLLLGLVAIIFWGLTLWQKRTPRHRLLLWGILLSGPASVLALEAGWLVTEFGRQPWVVSGILRTATSATTAPALGPTFGLFLVIYLILAVTTVQLLLRLAHSRRAR